MLGRTGFSLLTVVLLCFSTSASATADITAAEVRSSIDNAIRYLKSQQSPERGGWPEFAGQECGLSALVTLAMLNAGVPADDPEIQKALRYLRTFDEPRNTYSVALQTMAFCAASPKKDRAQIVKNVHALESWQIKNNADGTVAAAGSWGYSKSLGGGDNSNTQFAILALYEAERVGVKVEEQTWRLAERYWMNDRFPKDGWPYVITGGSEVSGSMTCAGVASLIIINGRLADPASSVTGDSIACCGRDSRSPIERRIDQGLAWLSAHPSVRSNPGAHGNTLYYLYALERVGRLSGRRFLGDGFDWYREGAEFLVSQQKRRGYWKGEGSSEGNELVATSFALLFLSKGLRPVLISKYKYGTTGIKTDDEGDTAWNTHRGGVGNLTVSVERRWKKDLTWQTIDGRAASLDDLRQTPVLFISGVKDLPTTEEQERLLVQYIEQGGFIFAEACDGYGCDGTEFDKQFRKFIEKNFSESGGLQKLPPEHPVWYAERYTDVDSLTKNDPDFWLYGVNACCRTSIVYANAPLSCMWSLVAIDRESEYSETVTKKLDAALAVGQNVLAYATGRELKDKLSVAASNTRRPEALDRGVLQVAKLSHTGGANEATTALSKLLLALNQETEILVDGKKHLVPPSSEDLNEYAIAFVHGRRNFQWTAAERKGLKKFFDRGGVLFGDAICANEEFASSFRKEMAAILPEGKLTRLPANHPLFSDAYQGFNLAQVKIRDPKERLKDDPLKTEIRSTTPLLEAIEVDGRIAVIFSPYDISCALESDGSLECHGYVTEDATKLGVNIILYLLGQD